MSVRPAMWSILYCSRSSSITPPDCETGRAGIDVLVGLPSSDRLWSGGLPLLLEEQREGMARMHRGAVLTAQAIAAALRGT